MKPGTASRLLTVSRWYQPTSPAGRAVLPVAGGILFFGLLALTTWGIAALLSKNPERVSTRLATPTFEVGRTETIAELIADQGPLLFQGLVGSEGDRSVVLDHTGDTVKKGWRVFYAYPADRTPDCLVAQVKGTRTYTDCEGRTVSVEQLAPPEGVLVLVNDRVEIDLRGASVSTTSTTTP